MAEKRIRKEDWDKVEKYVTEVYNDRKNSSFRKDHERIWTEVDRQVEMKPLQRLRADGKPAPKSWHNAIELGELAKASEIITSDVMRIMLPSDRVFFQPHVEVDWPLGDDGRPQTDDDSQKVQDGLLRNLMVQQQKDFGLKARVRLSVKESLHHGSFVAEVRWEDQLMVRDGSNTKQVSAPVWQPYSMWNSYPDPSPSVVGTNLFYAGTMILVEFIPYSKWKSMVVGDGWIKSRVDQVEKSKHNQGKDVEIIKLKGDICIERSGEDVYLPNSEVITANGKLVYYKPAELDYPNVIFAGYERQDVRDPYYTSPIIKLSPMSKAMTISMNKFLDWAALQVEPPIEYDGNDPDYVMNDGPEISPGAKTPTRSMGAGFKALNVGDGKPLLTGVQFMLAEHKEGLGVSSIRAGSSAADRQTATESTLQSQGAEVRTMEFVSQLEPQGLLPFLYMQHAYNRKKLGEYTFYNDEMHTPDFIRAKKKDIQANVHFEVVGSKGQLGEEQRAKKLAGAVGFMSQNALFAPLLNVPEIALDMLRDAGKKNPEEWVKQKADGPDPRSVAQMQEMQKMIQQLVAQTKELQAEHDIKMAKAQSQAEKYQSDAAMKLEQFKLQRAEAINNDAKEREQFAKNYEIAIQELMQQQREAEAEFALERKKMQNDFTQAMSEMVERSKQAIAKTDEATARHAVKRVEKVAGQDGKMTGARKHHADGSVSDVRIERIRRDGKLVAIKQHYPDGTVVETPIQ